VAVYIIVSMMNGHTNIKINNVYFTTKYNNLWYLSKNIFMTYSFIQTTLFYADVAC